MCGLAVRELGGTLNILTYTFEQIRIHVLCYSNPYPFAF